MVKEVRKGKRYQINALIERRAAHLKLNNYKIAKLSGLTATQIKDMREKDYAYTTDSLIAILDALGLDLVEILREASKNV